MIDNNLLEDIRERFIAKGFLEIDNVEFLNSIVDILNFLNEIPDIKDIRVQFNFINHKCFINMEHHYYHSKGDYIHIKDKKHFYIIWQSDMIDPQTTDMQNIIVEGHNKCVEMCLEQCKRVYYNVNKEQLEDLLYENDMATFIHYTYKDKEYKIERQSWYKTMYKARDNGWSVKKFLAIIRRCKDTRW